MSGFVHVSWVLPTAVCVVNTKVSVDIACKYDDKVEGGRALDGPYALHLFTGCVFHLLKRRV
jgi:hypothetical protein